MPRFHPHRVVCVLVVALAFVACVRASSQTPQSESSRAGGGQPEPVLRLTFEYSEGQLQLVQVQELTMVLPLTVRERVMATDRMPEDYADDYALELRGPEGRTILVRAFDDPLRLVSETRDPENPDRILRQEASQASATFSVLVPASPDARSVLVTRPVPSERGRTPALRGREELGSFPLDRDSSSGEG